VIGRRAAEALLAAAAVAVATAGGVGARANPPTAAMIFLLVVLFSATAGGLIAGISASLAATAAFNYFFLPPTGTFHIADPTNWTAVAAFLAVSILASRLVTRAREEARLARARATEVQTVYDLSVQLFRAAAAEEALARSTAGALEMIGARNGGVLTFAPGRQSDPVLAWIADGPDGVTMQRALSIRLHGQTLEFPADRGRDVYVPLSGPDAPSGVLVALGTNATRAAVEAAARLLALALEREKLLEQRAHVEALREADEMRTALLRAVSHDLSTPLTAMTLQVEGLQRQLAGHPSAHSAAALASDLARLRRRVENLLSLARIETGGLAPRPEPIPPPDLFRAARESAGAASGRPFEVRVDPSCPDVWADPSLALEIIVNLVQNAHEASPAGIPLELVAAAHASGPERVRLGVLDRGPGLGVAAEAVDAGHAPRRGLGLQIAARFAEASGGSVTLARRPGGGTCAWVDLPAAAAAGT
jgi:two-component system sensor histidine kinase KdpD